MKRLFPLLIAFLLLTVALPATAQILRIHIDGTIQPIAAEQISRAVDAAQARHAAASRSIPPVAFSTPPAR